MKSELIQNRSTFSAKEDIPAHLTLCDESVDFSEVQEDCEEAGKLVAVTYKRDFSGRRVIDQVEPSDYLLESMSNGMLSGHVETLATVSSIADGISYNEAFESIVSQIVYAADENGSAVKVVDAVPSKSKSSIIAAICAANDELERTPSSSLGNIALSFATIDAVYFVKDSVDSISPESFTNGDVVVMPRYHLFESCTSFKPMFELDVIFDHSENGSFSSEELNNSMFKKLMDLVLPVETDAEITTQETLKQIAGFGLLSKPKHDGVNAFFYSEHGGSGKSSLLNQLLDVIPSSSIYRLGDSDLKGDTHAFSSNQLLGSSGKKVRVAMMDDLTDSFKIDGKLKSLMNGDKVAVRPIGGALVNLEAQMTFMMCSNKALSVSKHAENDALLRRMVVIPFKGKGSELDATLKEKHGINFVAASDIAKSEKDIKAAWLLNGLLKVKHNLKTKVGLWGGVECSQSCKEAALAMIES